MSARPWYDDPNIVEAHRERTDAPQTAPAEPVDISGPVDVVNLLLVRAGVPGKHRAYIDAVMGAADNHTDWFAANDLEIGRRLRGEDAERITQSSVRKAAQRARDDFNEWQYGAHLTLVETMPGGSVDGKKKESTKYRLPILKLAQQVYAASREHPLWHSRPDRVVSVEAKHALAELHSEPPRRERFRRTRSITVSKFVSRAVRAVLKALDLAAKRCGDPTDVMREFVDGLTPEGREALTQVLGQGVEHPDDGSTVPSLREEYGTNASAENVVPFPTTVDTTVDESVHGQGDNVFDDLARDAEEEFGRAEDAPDPALADVDPGGPLLVADTSGSWVEVDVIPSDLRELPRWAVFRRQPNEKGRSTKVPYQPAKPTWKASSTNPKTWSTIAAAVAVYENEANQFDGIFFAMGEDLGLVAVDLDHCVDEETGAIAPWALQVAHRLNSYTELSVSRTGLRIFVRGTKPGARCRTGPKEMYVKARFMSLSGWHLAGTPATIEERTEEIAAVYHEWFPKRETLRPAAPAVPTLLDDTKVLELGQRICPGFSSLWDGVTAGYPTHSEARAALLGRLAWLTGGDEAQMARLFRMSGLMNEKCEGTRVGVPFVEYEVKRAVERQTTFYTPRAGKPA